MKTVHAFVVGFFGILDCSVGLAVVPVGFRSRQNHHVLALHRQQQHENPTSNVVAEKSVSSTTRRQAFFSTAGLLSAAFGSSMIPALADTGAEVRGIDVTPFNSLMFQYRGTDNQADPSLRASDLNEPSISYADFVGKLKAGEVEFVEFLAPDGDAAYATLKGGQAPIRIGEGTCCCESNKFNSVTHCNEVFAKRGTPRLARKCMAQLIRGFLFFLFRHFTNGVHDHSCFVCSWPVPGYPVEQHDGWSSPAFAIRTVKNAGVPYKFTVPALSSYKKNT